LLKARKISSLGQRQLKKRKAGERTVPGKRLSRRFFGKGKFLRKGKKKTETKKSQCIQRPKKNQRENGFGVRLGPLIRKKKCVSTETEIGRRGRIRNKRKRSLRGKAPERASTQKLNEMHRQGKGGVMLSGQRTDNAIVAKKEDSKKIRTCQRIKDRWVSLQRSDPEGRMEDTVNWKRVSTLKVIVTGRGKKVRGVRCKKNKKKKKKSGKKSFQTPVIETKLLVPSRKILLLTGEKRIN